MNEQKERDEFERIQLTEEIGRARYLVGQYDEHQAFWRNEIETKLYKLGQLDERLGGGARG